MCVMCWSGWHGNRDGNHLDRAGKLGKNVKQRFGAREQECGEPGIVTRHSCVPGWSSAVLHRDRPVQTGSELAIWDETRAAASEGLNPARCAITHHRVVGRDHCAWYDRQRPDPYLGTLCAVEKSLDPAGILNPGVLLD
jgi:alkyldihydroxyacetonephosphate synthase